MLLDSDYFLIAIPGLSLSLWAQWRLFRARKIAAQIPSSSGMSGAEVAYQIMRVGGLIQVEVKPASGQLADHYDPETNVLRLSTAVESGRSLADVGIASHEAGHVLQHKARFPVLWLRSLLIPVASLGSSLFWLLVLAGFLLGIFRLIIWSDYVLWGTLILQLINLPIELDASHRARRALLAAGLVAPEEEVTIDSVLHAAAWKHVAATLTGAWPSLRG
jgi:Zn-dependent membrane protease YugP